MKLSRRKLLKLTTAGLSVTSGCAAAQKTDGVGPNRGYERKSWRGKLTCDNSDVPASNIVDRLSVPGDFGNSNCQMIEDSHEGPYFTCAPPPGKNISSGQSGQALTIALRLVDENCQPIPNGTVDVWACNAEGYYSGYSSDPNKSPPLLRAMTFKHIKPDLEARFCRGALRTDIDGIAEFNTIYPGFYYGQPVHVHFKAHVGGKNLLTSQAHFPEDWNERIMATSPYNKSRPIKRTFGGGQFSEMQIVERDNQLLGVLDLVVAN